MSLETTPMNATLPEILAARKTTRRRARHASTASPSAARVADAWLDKVASTGYDHLVRCLILEGAAGVRPFVWADNNARRNLAKAEKHFNGDGQHTMHADWFTTKDVGCWAILENRVGKVFRSYGLDDDERQDVLHRALYGLKADFTRGIVPLHHAGKNLTAGIRDGSETPRGVCAGLAGKFFVRKTLSEVKTVKRREQQRGHDLDVHEMGDRTQDESGLRPFGRVFIDIVTDSSDPVGHKVREFIRSTYRGTLEEAVGEVYFETFFKTGDLLKRNDISQATGKSVQLVNVHLNRKVLPRLGVMWGRNTRLQTEVMDRVRLLGGDAPEGGSIEKVFSGIKGIPWGKFAELSDAARLAELRLLHPTN